jgi:hypothetical protein
MSNKFRKIECENNKIIEAGIGSAIGQWLLKKRFPAQTALDALKIAPKNDPVALKKPLDILTDLPKPVGAYSPFAHVGRGISNAIFKTTKKGLDSFLKDPKNFVVLERPTRIPGIAGGKIVPAISLNDYKILLENSSKLGGGLKIPRVNWNDPANQVVLDNLKQWRRTRMWSNITSSGISNGVKGIAGYEAYTGLNPAGSPGMNLDDPYGTGTSAAPGVNNGAGAAGNPTNYPHPMGGNPFPSAPPSIDSYHPAVAPDPNLRDPRSALMHFRPTSSVKFKKIVAQQTELQQPIPDDNNQKAMDSIEEIRNIKLPFTPDQLESWIEKTVSSNSPEVAATIIQRDLIAPYQEDFNKINDIAGKLKQELPMETGVGSSDEQNQ